MNFALWYIWSALSQLSSFKAGLFGDKLDSIQMRVTILHLAGLGKVPGGVQSREGEGKGGHADNYSKKVSLARFLPRKSNAGPIGTN